MSFSISCSSSFFCVRSHSRIQQEVPSKAVLEQEMVWMKEHLSTLGSPVVLCHNDLLCKNIIHNSKEGRYLLHRGHTHVDALVNAHRTHYYRNAIGSARPHLEVLARCK